MSPTKKSSMKTSRPRKVASRKVKNPSKQRKLPKSLAEIKFCYYGATLDVFNGDATLMANPPLTSESATPLHATPIPSDTVWDSLYSASNFQPVLPSEPVNSIYPHIPLSYLDHATQVTPYYGTFQTGVVQAADNNLFSVSNYPCGRYADSQPLMPLSSFADSLSMGDDDEPHWLPDYLFRQYANTQPLIPLPSFADNLSMRYDDRPYWFPDLDSIPHSSTSYVSNASSTFAPSLFDDVYIQNSTAGSSNVAIFSNDEITTPFPKNDARDNFYYYDG